MAQHQVLIVSASTGTGHLQAARALSQSWAAADPEAVIEHVDLLTLAPNWVRAAYANGYELMATRTPRLWHEIYHRTDAPEPELARWGPPAQRILFREFRRLLQSRPWNVCLCTHFLPGQLAAGTRGAPPFAMVVTDLTLHHYWSQPRVRDYFVANERLGSELATRVPASRIRVTGIPVAPRFATAPSVREARRALGFDPDAPLVVVMGGGLGLGVAEAAMAAANAATPGLHVVAICGRNERAWQELTTASAGQVGERLHTRGYVDDVERYIAAADLVITKPGGLTTSEVLAVGRPLVLTKAIPGQEEGNTRVLTAAGAAIEARGPDAVRAAVERVFAEPALRLRLTRAARALARPDAAAEIVADVRAGSGGAVAA